MNPNAGKPVNPPPQTPPESPQGQFESQFGSGPATPPVADDATVPGLIDTALANLGNPPPSPAGEDVSANAQPVSETQPPEQTPAEKLKQQIADSVDAFLEEVTKEKTAA